MCACAIQYSTGKAYYSNVLKCYLAVRTVREGSTFANHAPVSSKVSPAPVTGVHLPVFMRWCHRPDDYISP